MNYPLIILIFSVIILLIIFFSTKPEEYGRIDDPNLPINRFIRKNGLDPDKIEAIINRKKDKLGLACLADINVLKAYCLSDLVKTQAPLYSKTASTFDEYKKYKDLFMESCLDTKTISDLCKRGHEYINTYVKYSKDTGYEPTTINVLLTDLEKDWQVPSGSYKKNCINSIMKRSKPNENLYLESDCEKKEYLGLKKKMVKTTLKDLKGCKDISNVDGALKCIK